jgi:phosphoadenosine phosphosulfate reductase
LKEAQFYNDLLEREYGIRPLCGLDKFDGKCHWVEDVHRNEHIANIISGGQVILRAFFSLEKSWQLIPTVHFIRAFQTPNNVIQISDWDLLKQKTFFLDSTSSFAFLQASVLIAIARLDNNASEKGGKRKYRLSGMGRINPSIGMPSSSRDFINANRSFLNAEIINKQEKLHEILEEYPDKPILVSLSGGKDSSVVLDLVARKNMVQEKEIHGVFLDTRNEFSETTSLVARLKERYSEQIPIDVVRAPLDFFNLWLRFGPPSWENRWCCKTQKFLPLTEYLEREFPSGVVTLSGTRGMESLRREKRMFQEEKFTPSANPYLQLQIVEVSLISDWSSLTVWLYLIANNIPFNPLYLEGLHRIGCWACPASPLVYFAELKKHRPALFQDLVNKLRASSSEVDLPDNELEIIRYWKEGKLSVVEELEATRNDGQITLKGAIPGLAQYVKPLYNAGLEISVSCTEVSGPSEQSEFRLLERQVKRALYCIHCSKCVSICPTNAITVTREIYHVNLMLCTGCLNCVEMDCPALNFSLEYREYSED